MKNVIIPLFVLTFGAFVLLGCDPQEDHEPNAIPQKGQVSLKLSNLLMNSSPINARLNEVPPADPYCSSDPEVFVPFTGSDDNVRVTFIARIDDEMGNTIGYKFRARNGTASDVTGVEVRVGGGTPLWSSTVLESMTEAFFIVPSPVAGVSIFWDGGSKGTASTNESQVNVTCSNTYNLSQADCSPESEVTVPFTGSDENVRVTFIARIDDAEGNVLGYKWRARNGTASDVTNVEARIGGGTPLWSTSVLAANTEVFFMTAGPHAGVSIFWDGGSKGTASSNETQVKIACDGDPCEFVDYSHVIPSTFNVFFVPTAGGETIVEENVSTSSNLILTIPLQEYDVYVTNYSDGDPATKDDYLKLPDYSDEIFMLGMATIDYSNVTTGQVQVDNSYAAVMVANNYQLDGIPTLEGNALTLTSDLQYYLIYSKVNGSEELSIMDIRGDLHTYDQEFDDNQQYRYILCLSSELEIIVNSVFDSVSIDVVIDGQ